MTQRTLPAVDIAAAERLAPYTDAVASFVRSLEARNLAPATVTIYRYAIDGLGRFLVERGMPTAVEHITREHVEEYMKALLTTHSPGTARNYFKSLRVFFNWLDEEGEIQGSPMARMHEPQVPDNPPPVVEAERLAKLLKACAGKDFEARRDYAVILVMLDTGIRREETARILLADVDLPVRTITVTGKGGHRRPVPLGTKAVLAVDRYLRVRKAHKHKASPALWLGEQGPLTKWGIRDLVDKRAQKAGLGPLSPHKLRHTFAHQWRLNGGDDDALMAIGGWRSREMLNKYGRSGSAERARVAQRRLSLGDRL